MACQGLVGNGKALIYIGMLSLVAALIVVPKARAREIHRTAEGKLRVERATPSARKNRSTRLAAAQPYFGDAPYICTPSGFGTRAHCFLRTSVHLRGRHPNQDISNTDAVRLSAFTLPSAQ